jgi:hypothetical protein
MASVNRNRAGQNGNAPCHSTRDFRPLAKQIRRPWIGQVPFSCGPEGVRFLHKETLSPCANLHLGCTHLVRLGAFS